MHARAELFRAIVQREVSFFDNAEVGVLTSRLGADCQAVVRCLSTNINVAARNSMQCVGARCLSHNLDVHARNSMQYMVHNACTALACGGM